MNPFADEEISLPDVVCMASFILIEGVYEIMTLNTNAKIYKTENVRMAKSQDLYIKLDTVIPNTDRFYVDSSNCNSTPNIKSESILYFESNLDEEIDLLTIIDDVFAQWIRILLGYQEARVEYLLYSFPCNDM